MAQSARAPTGRAGRKARVLPATTRLARRRVERREQGRRHGWLEPAVDDRARQLGGWAESTTHAEIPAVMAAARQALTIRTVSQRRPQQPRRQQQLRQAVAATPAATAAAAPAAVVATRAAVVAATPAAVVATRAAAAAPAVAMEEAARWDRPRRVRAGAQVNRSAILSSGSAVVRMAR